MTKKLKKSQTAVLVALRNYRRVLLKEYLLVANTLNTKMTSLFECGADDVTGVYLEGATKKDIAQGDGVQFENDTISQAQKILNEILSGYWKDSIKLFEILNPDFPSYQLFACYETEFSQLENLKYLYDMAGDHLSQYLE